MSSKRVGWCRIAQDLVLDKQILYTPYLRDDMDVYQYDGIMWRHWTPESQGYSYIDDKDVPVVVRAAMMMLS